VRLRTHKYGVQVPRTLQEAYELDNKNGSKLWENAIHKKNEECQYSFRIHEARGKATCRSRLSTLSHGVRRKDGFYKKFRYVADGH